MLNFQDLNKPKMGTSLCDVTMTLKQQEKFEKHLFSLTGHIFLQENVCLTLLPKKFPRDYTAAYTIAVILAVWADQAGNNL